MILAYVAAKPRGVVSRSCRHAAAMSATTSRPPRAFTVSSSICGSRHLARVGDDDVDLQVWGMGGQYFQIGARVETVGLSWLRSHVQASRSAWLGS